MPEILKSKKFTTALIAVIAAIVSTYLEIPTEQAALIVSPLVAYVLGQGLADTGKEKAKINFKNFIGGLQDHELAKYLKALELMQDDKSDGS